MKTKVLDKQTCDKTSFMTYMVPAFANTYKINVQKAYFYLKQYGGCNSLNGHWRTLHTSNVLNMRRTIYTKFVVKMEDYGESISWQLY